MNISRVAQKTGLTTKAIRFYEQKGLVTLPARADNGYRNYHAKNIEELTFLGHARRLGFTLNGCRELIALYHNTNRHSADVKAATLSRIAAIEKQIAELNQLRLWLLALTAECPDDRGADCPIMDQLAGADRAIQTDR